MNLTLAKVLIALVPVIIFAGLLWNYLTPHGHKVARYEMGQTSAVVQRLLPDERVSGVVTKAGDGYVTLLDEPVYFSVTPPAGNFERLTVDVAFDPGGTPTLELGGLRDVAAQAFDFQPLANTLLEDLNWTRHDLNDQLAVFSRDPESDAYQTFLETPPELSAVATYRASYPKPYRESGYTPLGARQKFTVSLRGPHELLTYIKDETFSFEVMYTDINRTYGSDEGSVKVFDEAGDLMTEFVFRDDGNIYDNQTFSAETTVELEGRGWDEGVYRIVLSGTSDIVWRSLVTSQRYLVVKNRVFVGDDVGYLPSPRATTVYTNAGRLTFETQHREGLQTLSIDGLPVAVESVGDKYSRIVGGGEVMKVESPVGDVKITGEGKYAFTRQSFFDPDPLAVTAFTDLESSGVEHVLAGLAPVESDDGWRVAGATYATADLAMENGAYKFALSAPGVRENLGQVDIHSLTVTFTKPPLTVSDLVLELKHLARLLLP